MVDSSGPDHNCSPREVGKLRTFLCRTFFRNCGVLSFKGKADSYLEWKGSPLDWASNTKLSPNLRKTSQKSQKTCGGNYERSTPGKLGNEKKVFGDGLRLDGYYQRRVTSPLQIDFTMKTTTKLNNTPHILSFLLHYWLVVISSMPTTTGFSLLVLYIEQLTLTDFNERIKRSSKNVS